MEKKKHVNTKEDIEFLRKFKLFVLIVCLTVGITGLAKCSYDNRKKNKEYLDENGIKVKKPVSEFIIDEYEKEKELVLRK